MLAERAWLKSLHVLFYSTRPRYLLEISLQQVCTTPIFFIYCHCSNNELGSKVDVVRDLFKRKGNPPTSNKTYKSSESSGLDHRNSQFRDLLKYISPAELSRPVQGHLHELDVTVQRLRNVSLRYVTVNKASWSIDPGDKRSSFTSKWGCHLLGKIPPRHFKGRTLSRRWLKYWRPTARHV